MSDRLLDRRWPWLLAAAAILLVFASTFVEIRPPGWDPRPAGGTEELSELLSELRERDDVNVLFILIDTLRADRLGSYGSPRDTSPTLDRLAAEGVRFARNLAQSSWTKSSMASLWTALYPARIGITRFDHVVPEDAKLPAEILKEAGFRTAGIYRNGWVAPSFGFDQGFEIYQRPVPIPPDPDVRRANPTLTDRATDESAVQAAIEFLRVYGRERWFLYMHLMDVHEFLYDEESALFGSQHSDIYDNSIRHTDRVIQVFLDYLIEWGHRADTIVVIASDHGEAFGERGFDGHAREVYPETTEVPLIVSLPFRLEPGVVVEARSQNVDIWPTILDLLGLEAPEIADGRSRVPEILAAARGEDPVDAGLAIAHLDQAWSRPEFEPRPTVAVSDGPWRYVRFERHRDSEALERLFDARNDPEERRDRSREDPDTLERLRGEADHYLASVPVLEVPTRNLDELELNQLRALGYSLP